MTRSLILWMAAGLLVACGGMVQGQEPETVRSWEESLTLPTYPALPPDRNPMFRRPLSYQGASRVIYPYALQDNLSHTREERAYRAVYLENEFIRLCVLPELGGRLFYATDKTNDYEMFYRQHVIKPSNIGMLGAWISGGIEWCVLHHHRASTFLPVDCCTRGNADGSKTIWIGELEPRQRMKWSIGITLFPGKSYLEAQLKIFNRTEQFHSFLYWANVATHVNPDYQVFFPPSTDFGVFHAKTDFVHWPIGRGMYRGVDYSGVDVSWWKNHPRPISIFAHDLQEGFLAGYDHRRRAGTLHVANPHIVAGAKLWEWGPSDEGSMWDTKVLTDSDGPYAELMTGAYSDNQPDYSWIRPHEVKTSRQYWYPLREIGGVKAANLQAAINLTVSPNGVARLGANTTAAHRGARIRISARGASLLDRAIDIGPADPFVAEVRLPEGTAESDLEAALLAPGGERLIRYQPVERSVEDKLPATVEPPPPPQEIPTIEQLCLAGQRIQQFHNARLDPIAYFEEALQRDPGDARCNIQLGIEAAQRGLEDEAAARFQTAIDRLAHGYTRPRDAEAWYQLGVVQKRQGQLDEATRNLYHASWDQAFHSSSHYVLAEIALVRGDLVQALEHLDLCLAGNSLDTKAIGIRAAVLRRLGRLDEALAAASSALAIDPLDHLASHQLRMTLTAAGQADDAREIELPWEQLLRDRAESYLELATDYAGAGLEPEALDVLARAADSAKPGLADYPTVHYLRAWLLHRQGDEAAALASLAAARRCPADYCFPFRLEMRAPLAWARATVPSDSLAAYLLGNLLFERQPEAAIEAWEQAVQIEPTLAIAHRNLGWGYCFGRHDLGKAIASYQRAIEHNPREARYYYELDVLHERHGTPVEERLAVLRPHHEYAVQREDALLREIMVLVLAGELDQAIQYLENHFFHIQEGSRQVHDTHVDARLLRGLARLARGENEPALEDFLAADSYPDNHQVGRRADYERNPQIHYLIALAQRGGGQTEQATASLQRAADAPHGDHPWIYYQGLAQRELGDEDQALACFDRLIQRGRERLKDSSADDVFASFGEGAAPQQREAAAHFLLGVGYLGKGDRANARTHLEGAIQADGNHLWARQMLAALNRDAETSRLPDNSP